MKKDELDESRNHFLNSLEINPNYADAYYHYGLLLIELKDHEEAKNTFDKVTEIDQNYSSAYFFKARILTHPDDFESARSNYETALDINEKFEEAHYYMAKLLIGGVATDKEGTIVDKSNIPEAKKHLLNALKLNPKNAKALYNLGKVHIIEGSYSKAKINFKKAISADKEYSKAHYLLGTVFLQENDNRNAEKHLTHSIKFFEHIIAFCFLLAKGSMLL